jgi:hypothetical protein
MHALGMLKVIVTCDMENTMLCTEVQAHMGTIFHVKPRLGERRQANPILFKMVLRLLTKEFIS